VQHPADSNRRRRWSKSARATTSPDVEEVIRFLEQSRALEREIEIRPAELASASRAGQPLELFDMRTPEEHTIARIKRQIHRAALLVIDDWRLAPLTTTERYDLLEDRAERASTLITSQLPVKVWHDVIGEPTLADAICDRLIHTAHVIELHGPSLGGGPSQRAAQKLRREPRGVADVSRRHAGRR